MHREGDGGRLEAMRRALSLSIAAASLLALTGCLPQVAPQASAPATAPPASSSAPAAPAETAAPSASASEVPAGDASDAQYEIVADDGAGIIWSFEPTSIEVIEADATGEAAPEGQMLVLVHLDGQLIAGDGDFYFDFRVQLIDGRNGDRYGLSSGTDYLAEDDLIFAGSGTSFTDGQGIYVLPADAELGQLYVLMNESGEEWTLDVPVEGA